jgi:hypothetical protein
MKRDNLIQRLVERKLKDNSKAGCVPCFGRALCFPRGQRTAKAKPKS